MSELKPCPFCGCEMIVRSNRDWHRPEGDHEDHCPIYDTDLMFPATDIGLSALVNCWNTRVTQPEATKPAPIPGLPFADLATPIKEFEARKAAALASPADALVAGSAQPEANADAKDAERLDFMIENQAYIAWTKDGEKCRVFCVDPEGDFVPMEGWHKPFHAEPRAAIDAARQAKEKGNG